MHWKSLTLASVLALAPCSYALAAPASDTLDRPQTAQSAPPIDSFVQARPALWVVKDADTTIYLFGTIHLLKREVLWFDGPVRKAFDEAQQVVLEVVEDRDSNQTTLLSRAVAPDDAPISSKLPEPVRGKFLAALAENGASPALFDHVKPWFAALTLSILPLQKLGYSPDSGVDKAIDAEARATGKTLTGLETADEQIGFFESLSEEDQFALLTQTIDELPTLGDTIAEMIDAWSDGEPDRLATLLNDSVEVNPTLEKRLLTDRNARWADWIKARLDRPGTVFIAVGAGHLAGRGSVQNMLEQRGIDAHMLPRN